MATKLKYFDGSKTFQKQKGFYIANNLGGPLDVTTWVLHKDNLSELPNKYIGKKVYVLTEDEIYYYNGSQWKQLHNLYKANTQTYKSDEGINISSQYLVKFYNLNEKSDAADGSENGVILAKSGMKIAVSLVVPTKYSSDEAFYVEYPTQLKGAASFPLYYKWFKNSFDNTVLQEGYSNTYIPNYSTDELKQNFSDKYLCEIYIEKKDGSKVLVAKNSCHVVSKSYQDSNKHKGLIYMCDKVSQYPRGFINTNKLAAGVDAAYAVSSVAELSRIPLYFGKRVYVHSEDAFYIYKHRSRTVCPNEEASSEDKIRFINTQNGASGQWIKESGAITAVTRYDNNSTLVLTIDRSDVSDVSINNDAVSGDIPYWGYRKMSYKAHLDIYFHNNDASIALEQLSGVNRNGSNFNPSTAEMYGTDAKIQWTVSVLTDNKENYHDLIPGDNPTREESKALVLPTYDEHFYDYNGEQIVSNPNSFDFEFGVTNDVYDKEVFSVKCDVMFNAEGKTLKTITKTFSFTLERKSYIDFTKMKITEVTPLGGKFEVEGQKYDFKDDKSVISDASAFFALNNTIGLRYKVFYTASDVTKAADNWIQLDSTYINFFQDDANHFRFTRKGSLPSAMIEMIGGSGNDNGKLPFGYYRIVPYIKDVMFNLRFNSSDNIKDYSMFQNITKFSLRTNEFGEDEWTLETEGVDRGNWRSGMHINYGDIVRQNGEVFRCINTKGSDYSPLKIMRTNVNELTQFSDSGYVLEGSVNEDYTFDKTSIKVGYFDSSKVSFKVDSNIKEWFDLAYPQPIDRGEWKNGMEVRYLDIVHFDGSVFQCTDINGTIYCPKVRYMTNMARVLQYNDEGYVLTGDYDSLHYSTTISVEPSHDMQPKYIDQGTIVLHDGNYYKALKDNNHCPIGDDGNLDTECWAVDRTGRFIVTDNSKSVAAKDLVVYGTINGRYIDMNKFSVVSDGGRVLSYTVIDASSAKMSEDSAYYSSVFYKIQFKDNQNRAVEKETVSIRYATAINPMASQKTLVNESFVYHPYAEPKILDVDSVYHRKDGSEVFLAETNGYRIRYNDADNFKVKYVNEKPETLEIDKDIEYYVDGERINPYVSVGRPNIHLGSSIEARMNFDKTGIVGEDVPNYVGIKMAYPIYDILFDFVLEDGLTHITYPYTDYEIDFHVKETVDGTNYSVIDDDEYDVRVWSVENDVFVNGVNIKNNPIVVDKEAFKIQIHSTEILELDIHAELMLYGSYRKQIVKTIPIDTAVPEHEGGYKLYEIMSDLEIGVTDENLSIGKRYPMTDILKYFHITFKDGSYQEYSGVMIQRMIDSGRIRFDGNNQGCEIRNNTILVNSVYPKIEIVFKGWETSEVDTTTYLNFYPEIDFVGFRDSFVSNLSAVDFGVLSDMSRSNGSSRKTLEIYASGRNLKGLGNSLDASSYLSMELSSYLDDNGNNTKIYRSWTDGKVEGASFNGSGFTSNEEMSAVLCTFPYTELKDRSEIKIDKYDLGFALNEDEIRQYGFIKMRPILNIAYRKADGKIAHYTKETENEALMGKLSAKIAYKIDVEGANASVSGGGTYIMDSSVVLSVVPNEGYTFRRWMKNELTMESVCDASVFELIVSENAKYIARVLGENVTEHKIVLNNLTPSYGKVSGSGIYTSLDSPKITATANRGFYFAGWFDEDSSLVSRETEITFPNISRNINYSAKFANEVGLKVLIEPSDEYGSVSGVEKSYKIGETYTVTANRVRGVSKFVKWTDNYDNDISTANPLTGVIEGNTIIKAVFDDEYIIDASCDAMQGSVSPLQSVVEKNTEVTLVASPKTGYYFTKWVDSSSETVCSTATYTFTPTKSATYYARFDGLIYVTITNEGNGTTTGAGYYNPNSTFTLTATPDTGWYFEGWYLDGRKIGSDRTLKIANRTSNTNVVAKFLKYINITVGINDETLGNVSGGGEYTQGASVSLAAAPKTSTSHFIGWYVGEECVSTDAVFAITVGNVDVEYEARFVVGYIVDVTIEPDGYGQVSGLQEYYEIGSTAILTASKKQGETDDVVFAGWYEGGNLLTSGNTLYKYIDSNKYLTAKFYKNFSVRTEPCDISYGITNMPIARKYREDSSVTVKAIPFDGYIFTEWVEKGSRGVSTDNPYTFALKKNIVLTAMFDETTEVVISVGVDGRGRVNGSPGGWEQVYVKSSSVSLVADTPYEGWYFDGWYENDELVSSVSPLVFAAERNRVLVAKFLEKSKNTVTITSEGHGTTSGNGSYYEGETVTLSATPSDNYEFGGWYDITDPDSSTFVTSETTYTFEMEDSNKTFHAVFEAVPMVNITLIASGEGTVGGGGSKRLNSDVTVIAMNDYYHAFKGWYDFDGTLASTSSVYTFVAYSNRTLTAVFVPRYKVTVVSNNSTLGSVEGGGMIERGSYVQIKATKLDADAKFFGWYKDDVWVSDNMSMLVTSDANCTYEARFGKIVISGDGEETAKEGYEWCRTLYGENKDGITKTDTISFYVPYDDCPIDFYLEVESETNYDKLIFIDSDGNESNYTGKETDTFTQLLSKGNKTFTIKYSKDYSLSRYGDYAKYAFNIECYG